MTLNVKYNLQKNNASSNVAGYIAAKNYSTNIFSISLTIKNMKAKKEDKHNQKSEVRAKQESRKARQAEDVIHSHKSQGRKTDLGTGRSKGTKKGLS